MRNSSQETPFDLRRHFGELARLFLPIFVVVSAACLIFFTVWKPGEDGKTEADEAGDVPRVGLLPAVAGQRESAGEPEGPEEKASAPFDPAFVVPRPLDLARAPEATRFDAPMGGSPLGALTYNAQPFMTARHLGDDLNGIGGWDSDEGDEVRAAGDGEVVYAGWPSDGWGNVVMILHRIPGGEAMLTFYGHLEKIVVPVGMVVRRGDRLGTVGKGDGRYLAHLHFEVRPAVALDPGAGYGDSPLGRIAGEPFIASRRGAPDDRQNPALGGAWDTAIPGSLSSGKKAAEGGSLKVETR